MPFIPHTEEDIQAMLNTLGIKALSDLFTEIPPKLHVDALPGIPEGLSEMEMVRLMRERAAHMNPRKCFIGAGAYEHHIPAAVWDLALRGEYLTGYTPYQAEASQGSLQLIFEYQTMMASLMGCEVSNASLYDGATALVEAVLMGLRLQHKSKRQTVWVPLSLHPFYGQVLKSHLTPLDITVIEISYQQETGILDSASLDRQWQINSDCAVLVIPQPNFFGQLEEVNALTDWGHEKEVIIVGVVNPLAMAWLKPPGQWGKKGADIACGEGQPFGAPLSGGGPYFGFLCCRKAQVRQMPGRVVGRTHDLDGNTGYTLTLQAREQHIRREKATSNICTNQGLMVVAATIYLSLLGPKGLKQVAQRCYSNTQSLLEKALNIQGVKKLFTGNHFHEVALQLPMNAAEFIAKMDEKGIAAGFSVEQHYPEYPNTLLVCVTETKNEADILEYINALENVLNSR